MAAVTREPDLGTDLALLQGCEDVGVPTLLRLRDQMKQQFMEHRSAVRNGQANLDQTTEEKFIQSTTKDLQRDIDGIETSFRNKTLALQRIQLMDALRNKVNQNDNESGLILETLKQIVLLSRTIIKYQKLAQEKEQQLTAIQMKRLSLTKEGRQKMQQIETMMKKQKNEQARMDLTETKMLNSLGKKSELTTIIQNVFQNIIIGSRINWAEDPSLKAIVLQLEKNYLQ